jgi:phage shock protein A
MGIFRRIFKIGESEIHSALDKLEDPIKLTEQGIRDLKSDLDDSLRAYAEVKGLQIRSKKEAQENKDKAASYEQKAVMLIQKAEKGELDAAEADRLASEALARKTDHLDAAIKSEADSKKIELNLVQLDANIKKLKASISQYELELRTLKARATVSEATMKLNKQMSRLDSNGTVEMLEKMKTKVDTQESLAEAYGEMANANKSIDDEIEEALKKGNVNHRGSAALDELKAKLKGGQGQ